MVGEQHARPVLPTLVLQERQHGVALGRADIAGAGPLAARGRGQHVAEAEPRSQPVRVIRGGGARQDRVGTSGGDPVQHWLQGRAHLAQQDPLQRLLRGAAIAGDRALPEAL